MEGKYNKGTSVRAKSPLKFFFNVVKFAISCHILDYTNSVTQILQGKNNNIIKRVGLVKTLLRIRFELVKNNIDNRHNEWYQEALTLATTSQVSESKPRTCF